MRGKNNNKLIYKKFKDNSNKIKVFDLNLYKFIIFIYFKIIKIILI